MSSTSKEKSSTLQGESSKIGLLKYLYLACMYAGKSTALINKLMVEATIGERTVYINSIKDIRTGKKSFSTHNESLSRIPDKIDQIKTDKLSSVNVDNYDVIGVDEFQFYTDTKPSDVIKEWVKMGKCVMVAGLDGDYKMEKFGDIWSLIPLCRAGGLIKHAARCVLCYKIGKHRDASHSKKIVDDGKILDVGGKDKYISVCTKCYFS